MVSKIRIVSYRLRHVQFFCLTSVCGSTNYSNLDLKEFVASSWVLNAFLGSQADEASLQW